MRPLISIILPIALIVNLWLGCKDDGVSVDTRAIGVYAQIIDQNGNALSDVNVHYIFYTTTNPVVHSVWIQYVLSTPQVVTLKVFDPFDREVSTLIHARQQPAGHHTILFDSSVTNGVYSYRLQIGDSVRTKPFFIRDDDIASLQQKSPFIRSDQSGKFFLSPSVLGIGRTFQGEVHSETIRDSLSIILAKTNYRTLVQTFRLDTKNATDKTFTLMLN